MRGRRCSHLLRDGESSVRLGLWLFAGMAGISRSIRSRRVEAASSGERRLKDDRSYSRRASRSGVHHLEAKRGPATERRSAPRFCGKETPIGVFVLSGERFGRSLTSRSSWSRTSPTRPSSPSRTRDCSTSCASAPTISANRCSSRPPPPTCSRSSAARRSICRRCSTRWLSRRRGCARRIGASIVRQKDGRFISCAKPMVSHAGIHRLHRRCAIEPDRGTVIGRVVARRQVVHDSRRAGRSGIHIDGIPTRLRRISYHARRSADARRHPDRRYCPAAQDRAAVHRQADRAGQDLRRPGGDRDRERAAVRRDPGQEPRSSRRRASTSRSSSPT